MKKFIYAFFALFMLAACQEKDTTFVGNEYKLLNAPDNAEITLGFDGASDRFFGKAAINRYFGTYKSEGNNLTFGPAGATMMAGPEELMKAEYQYLTSLADIKTFKLDGTKLILINDKGEELTFEKTGKVKQEQ